MPKCAICLETDAPNVPHDRYVRLPCTHYSPNDPEDCLHLSCLAEAFETQAHEGGQPSCPICRAALSAPVFQALVTQFTEDRRDGLPCSLTEDTDIPDLIAWLDAEAQSLTDRANAGGNGVPGAGGGNAGGGGGDQNDDDGGGDGQNDDDGGGDGQNDDDGGNDAPGGGYEPPGDQEQGDNWGGGGEGYR